MYPSVKGVWDDRCFYQDNASFGGNCLTPHSLSSQIQIWGSICPKLCMPDEFPSRKLSGKCWSCPGIFTIWSFVDCREGEKSWLHKLQWSVKKMGAWEPGFRHCKCSLWQHDNFFSMRSFFCGGYHNTSQTIRLSALKAQCHSGCSSACLSIGGAEVFWPSSRALNIRKIGDMLGLFCSPCTSIILGRAWRSAY